MKETKTPSMIAWTGFLRDSSGSEAPAGLKMTTYKGFTALFCGDDSQAWPVVAEAVLLK